MAENKDEMLANFQACTGIEDVATAFSHLENSKWDLMRAVNQVIPDSSIRTNDSSPDIEMIEEIPNSRRQTDFSILKETLNEQKRLVESQIELSKAFKIQNNWKDATAFPSTSNHIAKYKFLVAHENIIHILELPNTANVLDLKKKIQDVTSVPTCRQAITGWPHTPRHDTTLLSSLSLQSETNVRVRDTTSEGMDGDETLDSLKREYILLIKNEMTKKEHKLAYPGSKTILDVKTDMSDMSDTPVRLQEWTGWPTADDSVLLSMAGIDHPEHRLTFRARTQPLPEPKKPRNVLRIDDSDEGSAEEFEDAADNFTGDEELFMPEAVSRKLHPLIPDNVEDETVGCLQFADEFSSRYGPIHPEFFPGTLEEAIKDGCFKPAKERRLLALYLHHDRSVLSNVFCTQLLCCESVIQILAAYFVLWGWDLTFPHNQQKFLNSFTSGLGHMAAMQIKTIPVERMPAIIIISRVRSGIEIMSVIQGNVGVNELMASLSETVDVFVAQQKVEVREEEERSAREMIMMQQDAAYKESLETDRAKEEARRQQEEVSNQEKQREHKQQVEEAAKKEAERITVESRLPAEPSESEAAITKIRVRVPKGEFLERRFRETDTLQTLLDWLHVQGYRSAEYKLLSSWPRRDLTAADTASSLKLLSLCPQETVILEERLAASSTCKKWRDAFYFYPNWRKLELITEKFHEEKNSFILSKGKKHCKAITITYDAQYFSKVASMLQDWSANHRLQNVQLVGSGHPDLKAFSSGFNKSVFPFLENCTRLVSLHLSHFDNLDRLNNLTEKHSSSLVYFGCGTICTLPSSNETSELPRVLNISSLQNLKILYLEGEWVTEDLLIMCGNNLKKLKRLIVTVREGSNVADISLKTWNALHDMLPRCELHVNYLHITGGADDFQSFTSCVLTTAPNITRLRLVYCSPEFQEFCMNALMREMKLLHTLRSIWAIFDQSQHDLVIRHPFVVCAWRFKHLQEILLSGALFDDYDVIGMLRMRKKLRLRIAKEDVLVQSNAKSFTEFQKQVKEACENDEWEPMDSQLLNNLSLPPADREAAVLREILKEDLNIL